MMKRKNGPGRCLGDADIARFVDKTLPADRRRAAIEHMADCAQCRSAAIEVGRLAALPGHRVPSDLAQRAFAAARASRRIIPLRFALPLAAAALVIVASVVAINIINDTPQEGIDLASSAPAVAIDAGNAPKTARVASRRGVAAPSAAPDMPRVAAKDPRRSTPHGDGTSMLRAGWAYFQLSSTQAGDTKLIETLSRDLAAAKLRRDEGVDLVITQQYPEFLEKLARLPREEQKEFIDGYVLSMLFYLDEKGGLKRECMAKSRDLLADASGDTVRDVMLYSPECALPER